MATRLQRLLRILCSRRTEWNYALFWKLRHHVPMVLTCEDACYYNRFEHETSESKSFETSHDPLGLDVEKMSHHVYSHGEGIVGQVAATGIHRWISSVDHPVYLFPYPELDGWQTQFSVGIKTIVFVAVPHGVVQLGCLSEVNEDLKLLSYIRDLFSSLEDSSTCYIQNPFNLRTEISMLQMSNNPNAFEKQSTVMDQVGHSSEERLLKLITSASLKKPKVENNTEVQPQCELYGNLLETTVVKSRLEDDAVENDVSLSTYESALTTEATPRPYFNQSQRAGSTFTGCSSVLEEGFSTHMCKEAMVNSIGVNRSNKKRAKKRDRELVEDRIKQLRRLVPNGSKCSIDSLLEKTVEHMVFLQDAATKTDKFSYSSKSRKCSNDTRMLKSGYDHGSCWAVEVGEDMKICPIVVENLSVDGQMLIEMSLEDGHNFLEIAESIRSLGLTILKAFMETRGDKVWMSFVVEGRVLHRTQVLWSLLQLLQVETTTVT